MSQRKEVEREAYTEGGTGAKRDSDQAKHLQKDGSPGSHTCKVERQRGTGAVHCCAPLIVEDTSVGMVFLGIMHFELDRSNCWAIVTANTSSSFRTKRERQELQMSKSLSSSQSNEHAMGSEPTNSFS